MDEVRWLDDDEQEAWLALLAVVAWLPAALDTQLRRDAGINNFEYGVLSHLSMVPEREERMSELAARANSTLTRLSKVVDRFAERGWVTRRPDPGDGRYTLAALTPLGWEAVRRAAPGHVEHVRSVVFDHLTDADVRDLRRVARRIAEVVADRPYGP